MFQIQNIKISLMGVINITPDSFSDGGKFNSKKSCEKQIDFFLNEGVDILDFGAESTAPMNSSIEYNEEINRYEKILLPILENKKIDTPISFDTYKTSTIKSLLEKTYIKNLYEKEKVYWNDVSGKVNSAKKVLSEFPKLHYIHCHNLVPSREETLNHMEYQKENIDLVRFFKDSNYILDPCFGFSKSREQNHQLLNELDVIFNELNAKQWVIGISRKSFLRFSHRDKLDPKLIQETEGLQITILNRLIRKLLKLRLSTHLILRMHDPISFKALEYDLKTFK